MEKLEGGILGTVFRNDENGWTVLTVRSGRSEVTVVGTLPALGPGEQAVFFGEWTEHKSYGRQFKCVSCEIQTPTTLLGIERYLGSGVIKGIGPATATQIVRQFGEETLTVLSEHPERLTEIPGIGPKKMALIAESYREHEAARKGMIFLQSYGIPPALAMQIALFYGDRTQEVVREDPYRLCDDLEGVGFRTADRIGIALGIAPTSDSRIRCAMKYVLREAAASAGHVYLPEDELCGTVRLLYQPAEEAGPGSGAPAVVADGALEGVDAIIGEHVQSQMPAGKIGWKPDGDVLSIEKKITKHHLDDDAHGIIGEVAAEGGR